MAAICNRRRVRRARPPGRRRQTCAPSASTPTAPLLTPGPGSHGVIGDRAYAAEWRMWLRWARWWRKGGPGACCPSSRYLGHGRATADSHFDCPSSGRREGWSLRFRAVPQARNIARVAMTAPRRLHCLRRRAGQHLQARDRGRHPRQIGFEGLLMSDDLAMKALAGSVVERAAAVFAAGSDMVLACNGGLRKPRRSRSARRLRGAPRAVSSAPVPYSGNSSPSRSPSGGLPRRVLHLTAQISVISLCHDPRFSTDQEMKPAWVVPPPRRRRLPARFRGLGGCRGRHWDQDAPW